MTRIAAGRLAVGDRFLEDRIRMPVRITNVRRFSDCVELGIEAAGTAGANHYSLTSVIYKTAKIVQKL
ncbi:hypothetical protein FHR81_002031 [Actinoalloteichus hoggarensis]|uniref:Uncharacterized protein n=1 Tax=Actinoalloteichus hoggarensis TaxID=1470176 RepID=A0A221W581_9PSEU|nr:hypothetical protein AHOG_17185 [Actinoalloteichus hoggarensis]MBB5920993.1 hypothetical protein [Actinoalloteichus hoggarensis]